MLLTESKEENLAIYALRTGRGRIVRHKSLVSL